MDGIVESVSQDLSQLDHLQLFGFPVASGALTRRLLRAANLRTLKVCYILDEDVLEALKENIALREVHLNEPDASQDDPKFVAKVHEDVELH